MMIRLSTIIWRLCLILTYSFLSQSLLGKLTLLCSLATHIVACLYLSHAGMSEVKSNYMCNFMLVHSSFFFDKIHYVYYNSCMFSTLGKLSLLYYPFGTGSKGFYRYIIIHVDTRGKTLFGKTICMYIGMDKRGLPYICAMQISL